MTATEAMEMFLIGLSILVAVVSLYMLPSIIAGKTNKRNQVALVNFFLGWTIIGWIVALVWAIKAKQEPSSNVSPEERLITGPFVYMIGFLLSISVAFADYLRYQKTGKFFDFSMMSGGSLSNKIMMLVSLAWAPALMKLAAIIGVGYIFYFYFYRRVGFVYLGYIFTAVR